MVVLLLAGSLAGCASNSVSESPWLVQRDTNAPKRCEPLTADQELVLGLSQEMADAGRRHAALASLERLPSDVPQVRLGKARLLRQLGHGNEAEALYGSLLNTCLKADASHGLGQIEASRGNHIEALNHLRAAASLSPANEAIRNDLGVVYMNQRRLSEARFELLTAMELDENARRAPQNLLVLLVYQGNWRGARELVSAKGLSSDDFNKAEQRARIMRNNDLASQTQPVAREQKPAAAVAPVPAPVQTVASTAAPGLVQVPVTVPAPAPVTARAPVAVRDIAATPAPARSVTPMPLSVAAQAWAAEKAAPRDGAARQIRGVQQKPTVGARPLVCRSSGASTPGLAVMECLPDEG